LLSYNAIAESLEKEDYDDGSMGPVLLRLAWCVLASSIAIGHTPSRQVYPRPGISNLPADRAICDFRHASGTYDKDSNVSFRRNSVHAMLHATTAR
jgi:hypothetical protein